MAAVKISGVLKDGAGKPIQNCTIQLKAKRNSTTVLVSGDYLRVTDNKGKTHDVLTGSDDGRHSNTSLAWGAGVQFNPTESVTIDLAYEGSGSGDWRTDAFIVGIGYRF
ncbi:Ail/Lom family outer membrane beta-barrel protein [Escherichia coli]|nr:Ail/Lom family outer membrane beta-barrel protein [Escherichia coli]